MNKRELGVIASRLFGIYCFVEAIKDLRDPLLMIGTNPTDSQASYMIGISFAPVSAMTACGILFFQFARRVSEKIMPANHDDVSIPSFQSAELQSVLFSFAGVILIGFALGGVFQSIRQLITFNQRLYPGNAMLSKTEYETLWMLSGGVLQLLLGVGLFFGAKTISQYWHRLRELKPSV